MFRHLKEAGQKFSTTEESLPFFDLLWGASARSSGSFEERPEEK
ncbi:hypothetical protein [Paenibacillus illinoisensis]|nr:hypothetical protein [Paenibacillus illinoisensis]